LSYAAEKHPFWLTAPLIDRLTELRHSVSNGLR
jgi:hypothetical protein